MSSAASFGAAEMWRWLFLFACVGAVRGEVYVHFDEVSAGTPLSVHYSTTHGLSLIGMGDGGPFEVIADTMCGGALSAPHVLSLNNLAACPEINDARGYFELEFNTEQAFVSIRTLHSSPGTVSYLKAYSGPEPGDFLDQIYGDFNLVGVAQTLRIARNEQQVQIRRVRFGVFNYDNRRAAFDDLRFEKLPIAVSHERFGAIKARW